MSARPIARREQGCEWAAAYGEQRLRKAGLNPRLRPDLDARGPRKAETFRPRSSPWRANSLAVNPGELPILFEFGTAVHEDAIFRYGERGPAVAVVRRHLFRDRGCFARQPERSRVHFLP